MRTETPPTIRLQDYKPSDYLIDHVSLDVDLRPDSHSGRLGPENAAQPGIERPSTRPCGWTVKLLSSSPSPSMARRSVTTATRSRRTS